MVVTFKKYGVFISGSQARKF